MTAQPADGASTPEEILRRYINRDHDHVLALTAAMPSETQADYLHVHDEALAALAVLATPRLPEAANADVLADYLTEIGARYAARLFRGSDNSPAEIWAACDEPYLMLELLDALRPTGYTRLIRDFMVKAITVARSLELPEDEPLVFTPTLETALAAARARAAGEINLSELPKVKTLHKQVTAEAESLVVDRAMEGSVDRSVGRALSLVISACAENVSWGVRELTARVADHAYAAAYTTAHAAADAAAASAGKPKPVYNELGDARAQAEQGRQEMQARLAAMLRERFPHPFV